MENFSSCNLIFFLDILIGKMEASEHSEVSGFALDLKKNLSLHFSNLDIQEKYQITLGKIFHTLRQNNAWRKVPLNKSRRATLQYQNLANTKWKIITFALKINVQLRKLRVIIKKGGVGQKNCCWPSPGESLCSIEIWPTPSVKLLLLP